MKIYIDLVLLLNFFFDFLLLLTVSVVLRRNAKFHRLIYGAFVGSLSILVLFLKINSFQLFLIKLWISILMILISFGYHDLKYTIRNCCFLYMTSILLGGFLYFLNVQTSYRQEGLVFYHDGLSINVVVLVLFSPVILYSYIRQAIKLKNTYASYYPVDLYIKGKMISCSGFLDTGNQLVDPYGGRPIILVNHQKIDQLVSSLEFVFVPFHALNHEGMLKCVKIDKMVIYGIEKTDFLVGIMEDRIKIDGIDCILHNKLMEGIIK